MKKAIVTGGAGFIGSHLVKRLHNDGWSVVVIDNFSTGTRERLEGLECQIIECGVNDPLPNIEHDALFHLAAPISVLESLQDPEKYYRQIVDGTKNVVNWSVGMGCRSILFASTAGVYGDTEEVPIGESRPCKPISPYASAKYFAEGLVQDATVGTVSATVLRFFNVFGEGQAGGGYASVLPIFRKQWDAGEALTVRGDGTQTRDFIWVEDLVEAMILSQQRVRGFRLYNVGSGEEISINQLANSFGGEIRYIEPIKEPKRSLACINLIRRELGWEPTMDVEHWIETIR